MPIPGKHTDWGVFHPFTSLPVLPLGEFPELANNILAQYSFIVPNVLDDAHDGSLADADRWQTNIDPLIQSPLFQVCSLAAD